MDLDGDGDHFEALEAAAVAGVDGLTEAARTSSLVPAEQGSERAASPKATIRGFR